MKGENKMLRIPLKFDRYFKITTDDDSGKLPAGTVIQSEYVYGSKIRSIATLDGVSLCKEPTPLPFDMEMAGLDVISRWHWTNPYYRPIKRWLVKNLPQLNGRWLWRKGARLVYLLTDGTRVAPVKKTVGLQQQCYNDVPRFNRTETLKTFRFDGIYLGGTDRADLRALDTESDAPPRLNGFYLVEGRWYNVYNVDKKNKNTNEAFDFPWIYDGLEYSISATYTVNGSIYHATIIHYCPNPFPPPAPYYRIARFDPFAGWMSHDSGGGSRVPPETPRSNEDMRQLITGLLARLGRLRY